MAPESIWFDYLADNKKIFPPYYATPIVSQTALKKFSDLEQTLNLLSVK